MSSLFFYGKLFNDAISGQEKGSRSWTLRTQLRSKKLPLPRRFPSLGIALKRKARGNLSLKIWRRDGKLLKRRSHSSEASHIRSHLLLWLHRPSSRFTSPVSSLSLQVNSCAIPSSTRMMKSAICWRNPVQNSFHALLVIWIVWTCYMDSSSTIVITTSKCQTQCFSDTVLTYWSPALLLAG